MSPQPDFIHEFVGASNQTLLLLHGTGSYGRDLIPLGGELDLSSVLIWIATGSTCKGHKVVNVISISRVTRSTQ
jgi:predicted esterase